MSKSLFRRFLLTGVAVLALPAGVLAQEQASAPDDKTQLAAVETQAEQIPTQVAQNQTQLAQNATQISQAAIRTQRPEYQVEEVYVTARRREERSQDIPVSLQAISGEDLERKGTIDLQNIIAQTPGLNSTGGNPRNFSVLIRGIGYAPTAADGLDNAIGVYIDGVYQSRPGQVLQDLVDVSSFEVLRGPQGTLFGRNAAAGALNITINKPSFTPSQTFELSAGNNSFVQGKATITGPITDNLAFRASLYGTSADGWVRSPFKTSFFNAAQQKGIYAPTAADQPLTSSTGRYGGRLQFLWNATDKLSVNVSADLVLENDTAAGFSSGGGITRLYGPGDWGINTTAAQQANVTRALNALGNLTTFGGVQNWIPSVNPDVNITNSKNAMKTTNGGVAVTADYDFGWAYLTSISAWRTWRFNPPQDSDSSPLDIYENKAISRSEQYSQEFRLASTEKGAIEWQAGVFLYYSKLDDHYIIHQYGADTIPWYNAYRGTNTIPLSFRDQFTGSRIVENTTIQDQNQAVYGQATWHITDDLELTGGARYTNDRKSGRSPVDHSFLPRTLPAGVSNATLNTFYRAYDAVFVNPGVSYTTPGYFTTGTASVPSATGYPLDVSTQTGNLSGQVSLSYKITPDILVYAAFSNGFQAGGLDLNNGNANPAQVAVKPSTTDNFEVGFKSQLFDHRLLFNVTAYQEVLYGFQTSINYLLPNGTPYRGATNAGNIRARGIEWDVQASLDYGLKLTFNGNYNDAIYSSAPSLPAPAELSYNGTATVNATGQRAPFAPEVSLSVTPSWDYQIGAHENFYTYAQYSYTTGYGTGVTQSVYTQVPGFKNLNLRAGVQLEDGRYDISLYANNATDEKNVAAKALLAAPAGAGATIYLGETVTYNPPATFGITLRTKF